VEAQGISDAAREVGSVDVSTFSDGPAEYFGIVCRCDVKPQKVSIRLGRRSHVYDLIQGEYAGETDRVEATDFSRQVRIFTCLPYRVLGLRLQCEDGASPGGAIRGTMKVDTGSPAPVRHVVHLDVQRPDGKSVRYLERNLSTKDGGVDFTVPLALNEPTGQWTLHARDVATGTETKTTVVVTQASPEKASPPPVAQVSQYATIPNWTKRPPTQAELVQEYPRAPLHRRIDIVDDLRSGKRDPASLALLEQAAQDPDLVLRWSAVQALAALGEKAAPAAPVLATVLRNDPRIRKDILNAFRQMGAEPIRAALPTIAECLGNANPLVRFETLLTIAAAQRSQDRTVRHAIVECFTRNDRGKKDLDCNVLASYLDALAVFPTSEEALPVYSQAVEGFPMAIRLNPDERRTVQHGEMHGRFTYYENVLKRLHENNYSYRLMAVDALKSLGDKAEPALPSAVRALADTVRERKKIDSGTRIQIWLNFELNPSPPADENSQVAIAICQFLAAHGEKAKAALPALRRLRGMDPRLAEAAQAVIDKIGSHLETTLELEKGEVTPDTKESAPKKDGLSPDNPGD
jgi:hypothetical protein